MLVQLELEQLGTGIDLVAMHTGGEGGLLQLLAHRLRLEPFETGRPDKAAGVHESGQLVAREQRLLERRVAGDLEVFGV